MDDTDLLRLRLQAALACFSVTVAPGCGDERAAPARQLEISKAPAKAAEKGPGPAPVAPQPSVPAAPAPGTVPPNQPVPAGAVGGSAAGIPIPAVDAQPGKEGEFDYFGAARDPYADHDEEEGCPSGDWCGTAGDAAKFAVPGLQPQLDCPPRIIANPKASVEDPGAAKWKGFSFDSRMQGRLVETTTSEMRQTTKDDDLCCYHWFEYCSGRPLLDGEEQVLAELRDGAGWSGLGPATEPPPPGLAASVRERLARAWAEDARMEHASIAAFARTTVELMALAAPPTLLADVQRAALDEIRHTQRCLTLASRYAGSAVEPGPLPALPPRERSLVQLACDTFVEGCVGETVAALMATRQLRYCQDRMVADTLTMIADDETSHAALAWRTIEWAIGEGGARVRDAVARTAARLRPTSPSIPPRSDDSLLEHGRLGPADQAATRVDAWREIIDPTLDRLLAGRAVAQA